MHRPAGISGRPVLVPPLRGSSQSVPRLQAWEQRVPGRPKGRQNRCLALLELLEGLTWDPPVGAVLALLQDRALADIVFLIEPIDLSLS